MRAVLFCALALLCAGSVAAGCGEGVVGDPAGAPTRAAAGSGDVKRPLVVFIGGAMDPAHQAMGRVYQRYWQLASLDHDAVYLQHDEVDAIVDLVRGASGVPVALVGHSWGADAALEALADLQDEPVAALVTLDGVGGSRRSVPPAGVARWINVYVDVSVAGFDNKVAQIGGHWGVRDGADDNIDFGASLTHGQALGMFFLRRGSRSVAVSELVSRIVAGITIRPQPAVQVGDMGRRVDRVDQCESQIAIEDDEGIYCTRRCDRVDGCPAGFECRPGQWSDVWVCGRR